VVLAVSAAVFVRVARGATDGNEWLVACGAEMGVDGQGGEQLVVCSLGRGCAVGRGVLGVGQVQSVTYCLQNQVVNGGRRAFGELLEEVKKPVEGIDDAFPGE